MPALDLIASLTGGDVESYEAALGRCGQVAERMPLVRVVVPHAGERREQELDDVFHHGNLLRDHKSPESRGQEEALGAGDSLYFHAGRTHPDYGDAAFVVTDVEEQAEATPFGLGSLCCPGRDTAHESGGCLSPIAHLSEPAQRDFYERSRWEGKWRESFGQFLALYFDPELGNYFAEGDVGRPTRKDPDGVFISENRDWRCWTVEVRLLADLEIARLVNSDRLLMWAIDSGLASRMEDEALASDTRIDVLYPAYASLPDDRRVPSAPLSGRTLFAEVDYRIQEQVLT